MKRAVFYSVMMQKGGPAAVLHNGYTDGTYQYYKNGAQWCAILPAVGLSVCSGPTRKACAEDAHDAGTAERIAAAMERGGNDLRARFDKLVKEAESNENITAAV